MKRVRISMLVPRVRRSRSSICVTSELTSTTLGFRSSRRPNASSCRVSSAARSAASRTITRSARSCSSPPSAPCMANSVDRDDHGQQVVEVVGDAAGQAAEQGQPLLVRRLCLALALVGDVAHGQHGALICAAGKAGRRHGQDAARRTAHDHLELAALGLEHLVDRQRADLREHVPGARPAQQIEQRLDLRVDQDDATLAVEQDDAGRQVAHHLLEPLALGRLDRADVLDEHRVLERQRRLVGDAGEQVQVARAEGADSQPGVEVHDPEDLVLLVGAAAVGQAAVQHRHAHGRADALRDDAGRAAEAIVELGVGRQHPGLLLQHLLDEAGRQRRAPRDRRCACARPRPPRRRCCRRAGARRRARPAADRRRWRAAARAAGSDRARRRWCATPRGRRAASRSRGPAPPARRSRLAGAKRLASHTDSRRIIVPRPPPSIRTVPGVGVTAGGLPFS